MDDDGVTRLGIEYDQGSVSKAVQTADQIQRSLDKIGAAAERIGSSSDKMGRTLADAFKKSSQYAVEYQQSLSVLQKQLDDVDTSGTRLRNNAQSAGSLGIEGLRRTGGALSQLGLGAVGEPISRAGDIAQVGKEVAEFGGAIAGLSIPIGTIMGIALPATAVIAGLAIVFGELQLASEAALKQEKIDYEFRKTQLDEEQRIRTEQRTRSKAANDAETADLQKQIDDTNNLKAELVRQRNALPGYSAGLSTQDQGDPKVRQLNDQIQELTDKANALGHQLGIDVMQLDPVIKKREEENRAVKEYADTVTRSIDATKTAISATSKQVIEQIQQRKDEAQKLREAIEFFPESLQLTEKGAELYQQLNDQLANDNKQVETLTKNILPLVEAREREAAALKKAEEAVKKQSDYITKQNQDIAQAYTKYEDDVKAIEDKALQKRADIEKQYADKQIEIARQAADAAKAALQKLEQARADLATNLGRDEEKSERAAAAKRMDIQISAQREEAKAYQDHQRELEQIRKDAQAREIGFLLDRNFLGLYQSRQQTSQNIDRANQRFVDDRQTRQQGTQQQLQDLQTSLARERQERLIAYQQQLADAQRAYQREIQQSQAKRIEELTIARQKRVEELNDLMATTRAEQNARRQKAIEEINMARLTSDARIKLLQAEQAAAIKAAYALTSGASGGSTAVASGGGSGAGRGPHQILRTSAYGNALNAGDWSTVNDRFSGQREQYGGIPLPGGLGLFFAMKPGNVTAGGGSGQNTFYITSHDPQGVRREVLGVLEKVMD